MTAPNSAKKRLRLALAFAGAAFVIGAQPAPAGAGTLPTGFHDTVVLSGLTEPTAVRFSTDGRVLSPRRRA